MNLSETNVFKLKYFNIHYPIISVLFVPGFSTLGSTGPIEKLKGGHEGEKQVTIFRYSLLNALLTGLGKSR